MWVVLKYKLPKKYGARSRRAVLGVPGIGPVVGTATRDFKTPLDSFLSNRASERGQCLTSHLNTNNLP